MKFKNEVRYEAGMSPVQYAEKIAQSLSEYKVAHLTGLDIKDERELFAFYNEVTENLGACLNIAEDYAEGGKQTGEKWMEIRYKADIPDHVAYRYSKNGQPLHTDESYISDPADVMFMYCVNRAPKGGETTFIDSADLVKYLEEIDPELLNDLKSNEVTFAKATESRRLPIISIKEDDIYLNWNYHCVDTNETPFALELVERFHKFLQENLVGTEKVAQVALNPGEGVMWWDDRLLHGRNAYEAYKDDDRYIWKTGIKVNATVEA